MAYVRIPREINEITERAVWKFSKRQTIFVAIGGALGFLIYHIVYKISGNTQSAIYSTFFAFLPFVLFGFYKPNGLNFEIYLKNLILYKKKPRERYYKTTNTYEQLHRTYLFNEEMIELKKLKRENPENSAIYDDYYKQQLAQLQKKDRIPRSVQDSIPFIEMYRNGVCKVADGYYSKTISFGDINYQLAQNEIRVSIFDDYCRLINSFGENVNLQLTLISRSSSTNEFKDYLNVSSKDDEFKEVRSEYFNFLRDTLEKGTNIVREKYLTFGIKAETKKKAVPLLEQIESSVNMNFSRMGVNTYAQDGQDRLKSIYEIFHIKDKKNFIFDWKLKTESGLSTKDFIAPNSLYFDKNCVQIGDIYAAVYGFNLAASDLSDEMLSKILNIDNNIVFNIHFHVVNTVKAKRIIKRKKSALGQKKIDEQQRATERGYDIDILPTDLTAFEEETDFFLESLQSRNEKMIIATITVTLFERNMKRLERLYNELNSIVLENSCELYSLDYLQENGLMSSLPLGYNSIPQTRTLTTSSLAVFVPFVSQEIFQPSGIYYGVNAKSKNIILADRKRLKNPNGLYIGIPGSGKTFAAQREMIHVYLTTDDDIIINDPEGEYKDLVKEFHGQVINISTKSNQYINPLDINDNYSDDGDPLSLKTDFILSFMELVIGGKFGLTPAEKSVIDRCISKCYEKYFKDPKPENVPILGDLYEILKASPEEAAHNAASALEIYVSGSLKIFNHRTNVDMHNRFICFDIKDLGKQLKKVAMLIIQDFVWGKVSENRSKRKFTWFYQDEFHLLFRDELTAQFSSEIYKRFRKWAGIPTGITQNVNELLTSSEIENIFGNSPFVYLLQLSAADRQLVAQLKGISDEQLKYLEGSAEQTVGNSEVRSSAQGLICFDKTIIPFEDSFPRDTKLYKLMTSKPQEAIV